MPTGLGNFHKNFLANLATELLTHSVRLIGVLTDIEAGPLPVLVAPSALADVPAPVVAAQALQAARVARRVRALVDVWWDGTLILLGMPKMASVTVSPFAAISPL